MGQSYFIWKNKDCRSMGVWLQGPVAIVRPEERVDHVQIMGRSGDLTETEGAEVYNSYIQTATIIVQNGYRVREIYNWLKGAGTVTFSGEPDRKQQARIIGAVTLNKHSHNADWWVGEVQFYCQPFKELLREPKITLDTTGATVRNNGDIIARPLYKLTTSATTVTLSASGDGTPEENAITLTGATSGVVIWIDSGTMEVLNADGSATLTEKSTGAFPVLGVGNNTVAFTGCSEIEIEKRERYL